MRLHSDWACLEQEFGCSVQQRFLMAVRPLDNPGAVTPFLLEADGRRFGLFLHVERGNVEAARLPPDIEPVYYRPYFTFDPPENPPSIDGAHVFARHAIDGCEYQWPIAGHAIAYEDTCLVTPQGGLNLTSDE